MDSFYDYIICGTGLKECIISGLLSINGNKVLNIDINDYYGCESTSLNLKNLYKYFNNTEDDINFDYGNNNNWNVDLIPKFIMSDGKLVQILICTDVKKYIQFQSVESCYVYQPSKGYFFGNKLIHKVPASEVEVLSSSLIPLSEKLRGSQFFSFIAKWNINDKSTWGNFIANETTMRECFDYYKLDDNIRDFVGHAIALEQNDDYLDLPCGRTFDKLKLYITSLLRFGNSPFIYPIYGLSTLPEGFSRLSAVYGGTYMLRAKLSEILMNEQNKILGIKFADGTVVKCNKIICNPAYNKYFKDTKLKVTNKIIRAVIILNNPIPNTNNVQSCQIIIPQKQLKRKNDIYIAMLGAPLGICEKGKYVAIISTIVETNNPEAELEVAYNLLNSDNILKKFINITDYYEPIEEDDGSNVYFVKSYDTSSHFEITTEEVFKLWYNITNTELNLEELAKIMKNNN